MGVKTNKYSGTQNEKNLMEAISGESQARNKYTYFAASSLKPTFSAVSAKPEYISVHS